MQVNVISPEERAKVEGKSYLRSRLAGFNVTTVSPVLHAHRTEFYCSRKQCRSGQVRLSSVFMDLTVLRMRQERRKAHGSRRRSLPDHRTADLLA
jgi:hypothetical protein